MESRKRNEREQPSAKANDPAANSKKQLPDVPSQASSSLPEYETWIEMGPEGEIVQRRLLEPLPKSQSDSALNNNDQDGEKESRIESFLNRTRNIFSSDKLKKSVDSLAGRSSTCEEAKPSWSPDPDETSQKASKNSGGKFRSFPNAGFKAPLKELQEKIKEKISERKQFQDSVADEGNRPSAAKTGFLSDIRNRFAMSPVIGKKSTVTLSEEEVERRRRCKTDIIDL